MLNDKSMLDIELRGGTLRLKFIQTATDETCFDLDCERTPSHWTLDGLDGYCTACKKHAVDAMHATLADLDDFDHVEAFHGKVVQRRFRIEMFTASSGWIPVDRAELPGPDALTRRLVDTRNLMRNDANKLCMQLTAYRAALGLSGDLEGETRVGEEVPRTFSGDEVRS